MQSATGLAPSLSLPKPTSGGQNPDAAGFGVYIHWPFCASKCPYCDFNSHVRSAGIDETRYGAALARELKHVRELIGPRRVDSIFIGGGTPSLMQPSTVGHLLETIAGLWSIAPGVEITLEANPSSVEASRFRGYRKAGVNRVSLGIQSLRDAELKRLGRLHNVAEARAAVRAAAETFERFSFDLIYARSGQSPEEWRAELREALELAGRHLSLYQLTIEEGTPFAALHTAGKLTVPAGEEAAVLYEITQEMTAARGLPAYEISNHAAAGEESRHNLLYWRYGEYAGAGPGAHGRLVAGGVRLATVTERVPEKWLEQTERHGHGIIAKGSLSPEEQTDEALLMGLRLVEGLDLDRLARLGGLTPSRKAIKDLADMGLLAHFAADQAIELPRFSRVRATRSGRMVLNELVARLSAGLERLS